MRLTRNYTAARCWRLCSLYWNFDLNFQVSDHSFSRRVPGTSCIHFDIGQLHWLAVGDFEVALAPNCDCVVVLGANQTLTNLDAGPFTSRGKGTYGFCVRHFPVQRRGYHDSTTLVDPDGWSPISDLSTASKSFAPDRHVENVGVTAEAVVSWVDLKRHLPFLGQLGKRRQQVVLGKFKLISLREGRYPLHLGSCRRQLPHVLLPVPQAGDYGEGTEDDEQLDARSHPGGGPRPGASDDLGPDDLGPLMTETYCGIAGGAFEHLDLATGSTDLQIIT